MKVVKMTTLGHFRYWRNTGNLV